MNRDEFINALKEIFLSVDDNAIITGKDFKTTFQIMLEHEESLVKHHGLEMELAQSIINMQGSKIEKLTQLNENLKK